MTQDDMELRNKLRKISGVKWSNTGLNGLMRPTLTFVDEDMLVRLIQTEVNLAVIEAEIKLLRDTAQGFDSVLEPEFEKGGKACISALLKMADHKEQALTGEEE